MDSLPPQIADHSEAQGNGNAAERCIASFHLREVITYLPLSRYWPLQGVETAICLALALALGAASLWWIRHRIA